MPIQTTPGVTNKLNSTAWSKNTVVRILSCFSRVLQDYYFSFCTLQSNILHYLIIFFLKEGSSTAASFKRVVDTHELLDYLLFILGS